MSYIDDIRGFFKGEIHADDAVRETFSNDASIFKIRPELVVAPRDVQDIEKLVRYVNEQKVAGRDISVTGRSAGTDMSGGALTESIVVDFLPHFNHIKEVGNGFAVTEPGVYYRDFEKETLKKNLLMPSYPASRDLCAIGGMISNNAGGEKTLTYGKTEDYVQAMRVVLADGQEHLIKPLSMEELAQEKKRSDFLGVIYREMHALLEKNYEHIKSARPKVTKNSAGYFLWNVYDRVKGTFDLTKVLVGAQGTLGLMTEVTLRLVKPKPYTSLLIVFLPDLKNLGNVAKNILQFHPESFESFDDHTFKIALKVFPAIAKKLNGSLIKLAFDFLPEFWMAISGGIPKLILIAEFTGDTQAEAILKATNAQNSLLEFPLKSKIARDEAETKKYWTFRRESFSLLRQHLSNLRTAPFIDDFTVRSEFLPEFLPKLEAVLGQYDILYTIAGHVGDGNFHIIPLMDLKKQKSVDIITELSTKVYELVISYEGSITAEHNDGLIRTSYLPMMYSPEIISLFEETKKIFDPNNVFNPGKKVHGSREYAWSHINRT